MFFRFVRLLLILVLAATTPALVLAQAEIPIPGETAQQAAPAPQPAQQNAPSQVAPNGAAQPAQPPAQAVAPAPQAAPAQTPPSDGLVAEQQKALKALVAKTDNFAKQIDDNQEDDSTLVDIRTQLDDLSRQALGTATVFRPRLTEINARLEQLGVPPAQGQPAEPDIVATERKALTTEKAEINAVIAGAQTLSVRIATMSDKISTLRSELFRKTLTKRYALNDLLSSKLAVDANTEFSNLSNAVSSWFSFVLRFKYQAALVATLMALVAALVLHIVVRRIFGRIFEPDPSVEGPSYLSRLSAAFWSTLLPTFGLGVFLSLAYFFFDYYGVLRGDSAPS